MSPEPSDKMPRKRDFDAEWRDITSHLEDIDHKTAPTGSGPRDWTPAPEPEEPFDPNQLEQPKRYLPSSVAVTLCLLAAIVLLLVTVLGSLGLVPLPGWIWGVSGIAAFASIVGAIALSSPRGRDWDDDGSRL